MIQIHYIIITLSLLLFSGCSETPENSSSQNSEPQSIVSVKPDQRTTITIGPVDATVNSVINILTDDQTPVTGSISWYVNNSISPESKSRRFVSDSLEKGDRVKSIITRGTNKLESNEIIIQNSPPSIYRAKLSPERPGVLTAIRSEVTSNDIDGDIVDFRYKWYLNGKFINENNYLEYEFKRGDKISLEIVPIDEDNEGKGVRLETEIYNSLPVVDKSSPLIEDRIYKYRITATDPDGDTLTYKIEEGPEGMTIGTDGMITWELPEDLKREYQVKVSVNDDHGGIKIIPFTASIYFEKIEE